MVSKTKPRVLSVSTPAWAGEEYMKEFENEFDVHVMVPGSRKETLATLRSTVQTHGPFDAILILMGIGVYEPFDEEFLQPLTPHLKIMGSASAGFNEFDVDWMTKNNIVFCNSRNAVNEATADMALLMMLGILRDIQGRAASIAKGTWRGLENGRLMPTRDPSGLKLGIVGMGAIGKHVARKAKAFNMELLYYKRTRLSTAEEAELGLSYRQNLHDLLRESDVITLHCPLNDDTKDLLSYKEFEVMKDGVFLVNTCRGPVINEDALINALETGKVCRAGFDVFHNEPKINPYFVGNDRVIIQPHMGGLTDVAWQRAYREAMENIRSYFRTGKAISPVNQL